MEQGPHTYKSSHVEEIVQEFISSELLNLFYHQIHLRNRAAEGKPSEAGSKGLGSSTQY
jgi:hypothetical protein